MLSLNQSTQHSAKRCAALIVCLVLAGCQSPFLVFAGNALQGNEQTTDSFAFAAEYSTLQLEVNPSAPYSVILRTTVIEGDLYIDAADARRWAGFLASDPNVRIKLGENIYPAVAEEVTDSKITERFLSGRTIYRIVPAR